MNLVLDAVDFGLILIRPDGHIELANRWIRERCRQPAPLPGRLLAEAFAGPVDPRLTQAVRNGLDMGNSARLSQAFHPTPLPLYAPGDTSEQRLRQSVDIIALNNGGREHRRCLLQVRDVTETVRREQTFKSQARRLAQELDRLTLAQHEIERQSARFREMARLAPVGLFETDLAGRVSYCNARVAEMLAVDAGGLLQRPWPELFANRCSDVEAHHRGWLAAASSGVRFAAELCLEHRLQPRLHLRMEATAIRDASDTVHGHIFTLVDVTELHEQARRSELRANHDALTGLASRQHFEAQVQDLLATARRQGVEPRLTLLFIDLDRFKQINDTHGHHAGDLVLKAVATRIRRCVRDADLVSRLGGDEFAVLMTDRMADEAAARIAGKIEKLVGLPINIGSGHVHVGVSVGWAATLGPDDDLVALMHAADTAMYAIKRQRRPGTGAASSSVAADDAQRRLQVDSPA